MGRSGQGRAGLLAVALLFVVSVAPPAYGDPEIEGDLSDLYGTQVYSGSQTIDLFANSGSTGDGHVYDVRPQCGDDLSGQAICYGPQTCTADDGQPGTAMDLYRDGEIYGETCLSDDQAGGLGVVTPGLVLREFRSLAWPQSPLTVQPPGGRTAVNLATYFHTDNVAPTTQTVELIGQQVEIEATPVGYVYHFDAGATLETTSPGAPYPRGDVVHEYRYVGDAAPSVDTVYAGRYRIDGGAWREIDETVTVAGSPVALAIVEVRPTLVSPLTPRAGSQG